MIKILTNKEFYTPPSQEIFDDLKEGAIAIWNTYDNTHGYADEKIGRIKDLENVSSNYTVFLSMFDLGNQLLLHRVVKRDDTRELILSLQKTSSEFVNDEEFNPQFCSICEEKIEGFGNNAQPVNAGRCCDFCNSNVVVPKRIDEIAKFSRNN